MLTIRELIKTLYNAFNQKLNSKLKASRGNWDQNDPTAEDYIKNRPFYTDGYIALIKNKTFRTYEDYEWCVPFVFEIKEGEVYRVIWNGKEYECIAYIDLYGSTCIGNIGLMNEGENTGEPFFYNYMDYGDGDIEYFWCVKNSGAHTMSIYKQNVKKIDNKYLPEINNAKVEAAIDDLYSYAGYLEGSISNIPTDVVRYETTQSLNTTAKNRARTNIGAVGYESQSLSDTQKTQARTNIGAIAKDILSPVALDGDYNSLKNQPCSEIITKEVIKNKNGVHLEDLLKTSVLENNGAYSAAVLLDQGNFNIEILTINDIDYAPTNNLLIPAANIGAGSHSPTVRAYGNLSLIPTEWLSGLEDSYTYIPYVKSDSGEDFCLIHRLEWTNISTPNNYFYLFSKEENYSLGSIYKKDTQIKQLADQLIPSEIVRSSEQLCYSKITETNLLQGYHNRLLTPNVEEKPGFFVSSSVSFPWHKLNSESKIKILKNDGNEIITQVQYINYTPVIGNAALWAQYQDLSIEVNDTGEDWFINNIQSISCKLISTLPDFGLVSIKLLTEEIKQLEEKYISQDIARTVDTISSPAIASVGQTLVVKSVDENGKPTEWEAVDTYNGPNFPETSDPYMQLVTDVDGNKVWEEKLCYRSGVLSLKLNSANASYQGENSSYGTYFESESTSNDPEQIAAFQAIGNSIYTNLTAQTTWTFYWDGICYQTPRRRLPVVMSIAEFGITLQIFVQNSRGVIGIYYNGEGEHTFEFETLEAVTKQLPYEFIPANVPVISEASVGQMVVVKAIDENGQPTAWETINKITVDDTLSISGAAADAKATSNAINSPKNSIILIDQINSYHYVVCMRDGNLVTYCAVKSIEVTNMPTKTEYFAGEYFDPSGMTVIAITYDGATKEITDFIYPSTPIANDDTYVEITYVEEGISYTTNVPVVVNQFDPTTALIDFEYVANEDGTYTITGWKGTLNGESSTEIIIPDNGLIIV